ncbi:hypothetical protein [Caballeronia terrestris]|nr:hypothetical protein [Caballeronia terrestris]
MNQITDVTFNDENVGRVVGVTETKGMVETAIESGLAADREGMQAIV